MGVLLPQGLYDESVVAFPMVLPMGWTKSPPYLCISTETIADRANAALEEGKELPVHRLESLANSNGEDSPSPWTPALQLRQYDDEPIQYADVYMDDLIGLAQ